MQRCLLCRQRLLAQSVTYFFKRAVLWGALVGQRVLFQGRASVVAVSYFSHFITLQVIARVLKEHDWPCC